MFDTVCDSVAEAETPAFKYSSKCFFVDGPGGSGKTFLYSAIIAQMSSRTPILLTASSGIAAIL